MNHKIVQGSIEIRIGCKDIVKKFNLKKNQLSVTSQNILQK